MKTIEMAREELVEKLTKEMPENDLKEIIKENTRVSFDYGVAEAHIRAKVLLESLEDFQKSIYNIVGGKK